MLSRLPHTDKGAEGPTGSHPNSGLIEKCSPRGLSHVKDLNFILRKLTTQWMALSRNRIPSCLRGKILPLVRKMGWKWMRQEAGRPITRPCVKDDGGLSEDHGVGMGRSGQFGRRNRSNRTWRATGE